MASCRDEMRCIHQKQPTQHASPIHVSVRMIISSLYGTFNVASVKPRSHLAPVLARTRTSQGGTRSPSALTKIMRRRRLAYHRATESSIHLKTQTTKQAVA